MRAPGFTPGEGARRLCASCGQPLTIKPTGRSRQYCSDTCRDFSRRQRNFAISGHARYPHSGVPQNPDFSSANSVTCKAVSADRGSAVKAAPVVVMGLGVSTPNPSTVASHPQADLVRTAIRPSSPNAGRFY